MGTKANLTVTTMKNVRRAKFDLHFSRLKAAQSVYCSMIRYIPHLNNERYKGIMYQNKGENGEEYGFYLLDRISSLVEVLDALKIKSMLDLGSGPGLLLAFLEDMFDYMKFYGYEIEEPFVEDARKVFNLDVTKKNILTLKKKDVSFSESIYFYEPFTPYGNTTKPQEFVLNLSKILTPGQYIIYANAGAIGNYLLPEHGFEMLTRHNGILVYEFVGKAKIKVVK